MMAVRAVHVPVRDFLFGRGAHVEDVAIEA
jgi:hypothetical protein